MSPRLPIGLLAAQSDRRLLELVAAGHERAFEVLVKRYRRQLMRYCRRMGFTDSGAEDIIQHAFLRAWLALERGVEVRAPKPWLYRIVHNSAVNVIRSSREEHVQLVEDTPRPDSYESPLERRLLVRETLSDLAELPPMQREAILMSAVDGRSHEEVAHALGITNGAVRGLLYRARSTLRDAAAALIPQPLVNWAAGCASRGVPTAERLAQLSAQGGGGTLARGAAMAATAAVLAAGVVVVPHHGHAAHHAVATGGAHAAVAAPDVAAIAQSPAVPTSQTTTAAPARHTASFSPSSSGAGRIATGSAPVVVRSHHSAPTPVARPAPAPASTAPAQRGSSGQHSAPAGQAASVGVAATTPTSAPPPPSPSPPKTEPTPPPPPTGSGGEKVKEELPPPTDDGGEPGGEDGHEEAAEGKPEEPEAPPKPGEKPHDE
jgi:RNA polymerase sigma factor (sigma-70 family)